MEVKINEIYKHFKGKKYKVLNIAKHSETGELLVIYQELQEGGNIWARPITMFNEKVNNIYRFTKCS